jgi:hypothetical protein
MREHREYTCAVATGNGFAMPYRVKPATVQPVEAEATVEDNEPMMRRPLFAGVLATLAKGKRKPKS